MSVNQHETRRTRRVPQQSLNCSQDIAQLCHLTITGQSSNQTSTIHNTRGPKAPYPLGYGDFVGAASVNT